MPLDPISASTLASATAGRASGAQLMPVAQKIAQAIAMGATAAPTDSEGWDRLVGQFTDKGLPAQQQSGPAPTKLSLSTPTAASTTGAGGAALASTASASTPSNGNISTDPGATQAFLDAVKQHESGGDYTAYNAGGGASGAYQFIQSTWSSEAQAAGYGAYANGPASSAPPAVQDAVAAHMAQGYFQQYGSWNEAAQAWYEPADVGKNVVPVPGAGNTETVTDYGNQIVGLMQKGGQGQQAQPAQQSPPVNTSGGVSAVAYAQGVIGTQYSWGGGNASGATVGIDQGAGTVGFDCSGLTEAAYAHQGIQLPRTAQAQYDATTKVPNGQLQSGDLVFFGQNAQSITHVGIYIGNGKMIDAPHTGAQVRVENYNWADYVGATRPSDATGVTTLPTSAPAPVGGAKPTLTQGDVTGTYYRALSHVMQALQAKGLQ